MDKSRLLAIILGFIFSVQMIGAWASSGTIEGIVKDKKSGEAIIGATVQIENTSMATASDIDGRFAFSNLPAGKQTIICRYLSYKTARIPVDMTTNGANTPLVIEMEEDWLLYLCDLYAKKKITLSDCVFRW